MLLKLAWFVIITRFSKPLLILTSFFLMYDVLIRAITVGNADEFSGGFSYYAVGASIFFVTMSLLLGGIFVLKSDRDYLLTLPLSRVELSLSLFLAQFIGSGISILFLFGFYLAGAGTLEIALVLVGNLAVLAALVTALGVVSNMLALWKRLVISLLIGLWCYSTFLGVPFTPVSAFTGELLYGSLTLIGLAVVVVPVALRELAFLEVGSMRSMLRATSSEYKKSMSFAGKTPVRAVYSYHLSFLELVGRMNLAGSTSFRSARVKTRTVLIITSILAAVYLYFTSREAMTGQTLYRPFEGLAFVVPILLGVVVLVLMSQGTFSNERGWLAFTSMDPATYLRHLLLSRAASALSIIGPFIAADLVLALVGIPRTLNMALALVVSVPSASMISAYLVARLGAVQQVKEEGMMPGQFELKQILVILPVYIFIGLIVFSEVSLTFAIIVAVVLGGLASLLLARASTWRGIAYRLTEKGFV